MSDLPVRNQTSKPPVPEPFDYTVGLVCCSQDEYNAILEVLEVHHERHFAYHGDYDLGRIGNHDVVVRVPPARSRRSESLFNASEGANSMKKTFPSIRFILAIGVASAAPSKRESKGDNVCVGDVVISTNAVNYRPDATVLSRYQATDALRTEITRLMRVTRLQSLIDSCAQDVDGRYQQPRLCGNQGLIQQPQKRPVKLHLGTVGLIGFIVRDVQLQHTLADQNDVLCFGTAFADGFPNMDFLSIYGISSMAGDIPDDTWYHHAAFAAAVCAKQLLLSLYKQKVDEMPLWLTTEGMRDHIKCLGQQVQYALQRQSNEEGKRKSVKSSLDALAKTMGHFQAQMMHVKGAMDSADKKIDEAKIKALEELETLRTDLQADLKTAIGDLEAGINHQLGQLDSKYVTREEWQAMKDEVERHSSELDILFGAAEHLLEKAPAFLQTLGVVTNNKDLGKVSELLEKLRLHELSNRVRSGLSIISGRRSTLPTDTAEYRDRSNISRFRTLLWRPGRQTPESTNTSGRLIPVLPSLNRQSTNAISESSGSEPREVTSPVRGPQVPHGHSALLAPNASRPHSRADAASALSGSGSRQVPILIRKYEAT